MNRSQRKYYEKLQKRKAAQATARQRQWNDYIEKMLAAYVKETDIPGHKALLCHEKVQDPDNENKVTDKYWFEHHEERVKIVDAHPDVEYLFTLCAELVRAAQVHHKNGTSYGDEVADGLQMLEKFMEKYADLVEKEIEEQFNPKDSTKNK